MPFVWWCAVAQLLQFLDPAGVKTSQFADLEPSYTENQTGRHFRAKEVQSVLFPFHPTCHYEDDVYRLHVIAPG
jgi:hypothetical protein